MTSVTTAPPTVRRRLRTTMLWALLPLCGLLLVAGVTQLRSAQAVHRDVLRLFEELRELALARSLVDELRGMQHWLEAAPTATDKAQPLVFADVRAHHAAALAALPRFRWMGDPSRGEHSSAEEGLLARLHQGLQQAAAGLATDNPLAAIAGPLQATQHDAEALLQTIEDETYSLGVHLDQRSSDLSRYLILLGAVAIATVAWLAWLLLTRVLAPVRALHQAALQLGAGAWPAHVRAGRADELGELTVAFVDMARRLRQSRDELEARVEARSREVLRSAQLAQLGTLAAGIAHEINNPLASIVAGSQGLLRELAAGSGDRNTLREYLQIVSQEALRARDITSRLLRLAHEDGAGRRPIDLGRELQDIAALFRHQLLEKGMTLDLQLQQGQAWVLGEPGAWRQVLLNLLRNALDAGRRGGRITARVGAEGDEIQVSVADDGPGIAAHHLPRIFEPFFTTKDPGQGTGLGLAIVHRIVTSHGGRIEACPLEPHGIRFLITLPRAPGSADPVS